MLQRLLDAADHSARVRNFGYSGATVSRTGNEPYWETPSFVSATRFKPHLTLIMLGTNDAQHANAASRATVETDLVDLVKHFRGVVEPAARVLISQCPPVFPPVPEIDFRALAEVIRSTVAGVAERIEAPLVDFLTPLVDARDGFPDGLHPNAEVAARIAQIAFEAVRPHLSDPKNP